MLYKGLAVEEEEDGRYDSLLNISLHQLLFSKLPALFMLAPKQYAKI